MKDFAVGALAWIFLIYYFFFALGRIGYSYSHRREKYEGLLGKELVVCGDTVMITDHTWIKGTFHLSSGAQIEENLAMELYIHQNN